MNTTITNTTDRGERDKSRFINRLRAFFGDSNNRIDILACFFLMAFILSMFAVYLKINGIYPFGKSIMSSYDMLAQVAPFIEHFYDVIDGKSSLFYSFSIVGGADVFGTLAYCCVSPFTLIFLLFGRGNVYYGTSIVLPLKIVCIAISAYIYLRKRFKTIPLLIRITLALSYAFCGYLYVSNTYINWVDILIYLPIVAWGFRKLVKQGKKSTFVVGLCLIIYTCFSIACFSLLIIYPLAIAYCYIVIPKVKRKKTIVDLVVALCLAVGYSLPILLPSLCAYLVSGRSAGLFNGLLKELKPDPLYYKISYIVTDAFALFFTFVYLIKYGVNRPIDRFLFLAALITLLPVLCDECCIMLNFGSYNSYALRFGFLNGFYFFFVAAKLFNDYEREGTLKKTTVEYPSDENLEQTQGDLSGIPSKKPVGNTKRIVYTILLSLLCVGGLVGGYFLCEAAQGDRIEKWFSSRFAHSLGGLEVTAIVFAIVAIIALCATLLIKYKRIIPFAVSVILFITVCGQTAFYGENLVYGNKKSTTDFDRIGVITDYVQTLDDGKYARIKFYKDYLTADMPFTLHTQAFSVFSSVINDKNFVPTRFFSFGGNGSNTAKSYYGSFFGDCLLGNRYYITQSTTAEKNYEAVDMFNDKEEGTYDIGEYRLYRNKYAFPSTFVTDGRIGEFTNGKTLFDKYNALIKTLGGDDMSLEEKGVNVGSVSITDDGGYRVSLSRNKTDSCFVLLNFDNSIKIKYSLGSRKEINDVVNNSIDLQKSGNTYSSFILYFGENNSLTEGDIAEGITIYNLTEEKIKTISERAQARAGKMELSAGKISVDVEADDGDYLFLNYIALPGHTATVNNTAVTIDDDLLGFMLIPLKKGSNKVVVEYRSPYVKYAVIGLIASLLIGIAYYFIAKRRILYGNRIAKIIGIAALLLCAIVVGVFMIFPLGVFFYKLVMFGIKAIIGLF